VAVSPQGEPQRRGLHAAQNLDRRSAGIDAKGVKNYSLNVVAKDAEDPRKTVGTCNGGSERIVYERQTPARTEAVARR